MSTSENRIVRSRETKKLYRVVKEYKYTLLVAPAWKKSGIPFTLPKTSFELYPTNASSPETTMR